MEQVHISYLGMGGRAVVEEGGGESDPQITRQLEKLPGAASLHLPLVGKRQINQAPPEPEFAVQSLQECLPGEPHCSLSQQV